MDYFHLLQLQSLPLGFVTLPAREAPYCSEFTLCQRSAGGLDGFSVFPMELLCVFGFKSLAPALH